MAGLVERFMRKRNIPIEMEWYPLRRKWWQVIPKGSLGRETLYSSGITTMKARTDKAIQVVARESDETLTTIQTIPAGETQVIGRHGRMVIYSVTEASTSLSLPRRAAEFQTTASRG